MTRPPMMPRETAIASLKLLAACEELELQGVAKPRIYDLALATLTEAEQACIRAWESRPRGPAR